MRAPDGNYFESVNNPTGAAFPTAGGFIIQVVSLRSTDYTFGGTHPPMHNKSRKGFLNRQWQLTFDRRAAPVTSASFVERCNVLAKRLSAWKGTRNCSVVIVSGRLGNVPINVRTGAYDWVLAEIALTAELAKLQWVVTDLPRMWAIIGATMSTDAWVSILLSIPIGIGTALVVPLIQRKWENRTRQRALTASLQTQAELQRIRAYKDNADQFTQYLIYTAIKTTFVGAFVAILSGLLIAIAQLSTLKGIIELFPLSSSGYDIIFAAKNLMFLAGQFTALVGSILIVNICRPVLITWTKVQNFGEYEQSVNRHIGQPVAVTTNRQSD
jgi:hypothetical protein